MQLPKKLNYLTHLLILKAVCKTFSPTGILELGCGKHSTSFFYNYGGDVVSLENDKEWCDRIKMKYPDNEKFKLIYHNLGDVDRRTRYEDLSIQKEKEINSFYDDILSKHDLNFLFVDHWRSIRCRSVRYLSSKFDIVVYHDAEDRNKRYKFNTLVSNPIENFFHWIHCSFTTHTGILINKKYADKLDIFDKNIAYYGKEFCDSIGKKYKHKIRKEEC